MNSVKTLMLLFITLLSTQACHAKPSEHIKNSRLTLQNYGFAYCMKEKTVDIESEAYLNYSRATGIYFNNGSHNSPDSYQTIENYIKTHTKSHNFKSFEGDNVLFSCLEIYNSPTYQNQVKQLDSYISPE